MTLTPTTPVEYDGHRTSMFSNKGSKMKNNTFKDDIYDNLEGHGVKYINVNRDASVNGVPSIAVDVYVREADGGGKEHKFTFAKGNHMGADEIASVIKSYLRNRT